MDAAVIGSASEMADLLKSILAAHLDRCSDRESGLEGIVVVIVGMDLWNVVVLTADRSRFRRR